MIPHITTFHHWTYYSGCFFNLQEANLPEAIKKPACEQAGFVTILYFA
jgi:hypothetical protein